MGTKLTTTTNDILGKWGIDISTQNKSDIPEVTLSKTKQMVFSNINSENPLYIDKIICSSKLNTSLANSTLALLEIKDLMKNLGNN